MTLYGTPGGTPTNVSPFQGTTPGYTAVNPFVIPVNPGVGFFPPNSNNLSGDSVMASASRAVQPVNMNANGFGLTGWSGNTVTGRAIGDCFAHAYTVGSSPAIIANGGSANGQACGGNSATGAAGGMNQTEAPGPGVSHPMPHSMPPGSLSLTNGYQG